MVASNPTSTITTAVNGSSLRPNKPSISPSLARSISNARTRPAATPNASYSAALVKILRNSWPASAPIAARMPISLRRCDTVNDIIA